MRGAITQLSKRLAPKLLVLPVLAVALAIPVSPALAAHGHPTHEVHRSHVTVTTRGHGEQRKCADICKGRKVG